MHSLFRWDAVYSDLSGKPLSSEGAIASKGEAFGYKNLSQAAKLIARMLTLVPRYRNANAPIELRDLWVKHSLKEERL
ncbi:hypothetical protein [Allocoleopsis sp.]|uniref:hypothetical protein n=1 Tax=Allocoleopsis sp. TaxID=3088169 RepID=UPI002FD30ED0